MYVSKREIRSARKADLYSFLRSEYQSSFKVIGHSIAFNNQDSIYIRSGYSGFTDFRTGKTGNGIDFLTQYLGYDFPSAVKALNQYEYTHLPSMHTNKKTENRSITFPPNSPYTYQMYRYLEKRAIPANMIQYLVEKGLLYQEPFHENIVFINSEKDYCEIRGTHDRPGRKGFHSCRKTNPDRFWSFTVGEELPFKPAYICESAIDAISLFLIHQNYGFREDASYFSIGGVSNYAAIKRIRSLYSAVLAVDNDAAGQLCRDRNPKMPFLIPTKKDWNEELSYIKSRSENTYSYK